MDYEKEYKEALERAKKYKLKEDLIITQDIFPELKVSDDERIKRVIKQVLYESTIEKDECYLDNGVTQQEVFAWLEKQGEQKPVEWSEDSVKETLLSEVLPCFMHGGEADEIVAKLDEVMSTKVQSQPKQEWSEEDAEMLKIVITNIECPPCTTANYKPIREMVAWLKSLRPQNTWKPSEEQMKALESATVYCAYSEYQDCLTDLIRQLKAL